MEKEQHEIMDKDDWSIVTFSNLMTVIEQTTTKSEWKLKKDQIAWEMLVGYYEKYNRGDTAEGNVREDQTVSYQFHLCVQTYKLAFI